MGPQEAERIEFDVAPICVSSVSVIAYFIIISYNNFVNYYNY